MSLGQGYTSQAHDQNQKPKICDKCLLGARCVFTKFSLNRCKDTSRVALSEDRTHSFTNVLRGQRSNETLWPFLILPLAFISDHIHLLKDLQKSAFLHDKSDTWLFVIINAKWLKRYFRNLSGFICQFVFSFYKASTVT